MELAVNQVVYLDKVDFNNTFKLELISVKSLILKTSRGDIIKAHKKVVNKILQSEEPIPCALEYVQLRGKEPELWLATVFTC